MAKRSSNLRPGLLALFMMATTSSLVAADVRIGIIGLDTSHAVEFTQRLNDPASTSFVPGGSSRPCRQPALTFQPRVIGWKDLPARSVTNMACASSPTWLSCWLPVDAVMVLSLDGRAHVPQMKAIVAAKKPVFLDKPVAASLKDAVSIYLQAEAAGTPLLSASALALESGSD